MKVVYIKDDILLQDGKIVDKFDKKDIITSSIDIKDVITYTFKLPLTTPKEQLQADAEIHFFENAGLNLDKEYKTHFIIKELEKEGNYLIEAIAIEVEKLHNLFKNIIEKTHWIDYISFSPFSFEEFYPTHNKEAKKDAFVYLDNKNSFIAVFNEGEYLYSKSLNPLKPLLTNIDKSYEEFIEILKTKGVDKTKYEMDEFLIASEIEKFFSDYFMAINNRLSYGKNIFYLDSIDNIYFYTPFEINGINELKEFWDLSGINFELVPSNEINLLDKLSLEYNKKHYKDGMNFSIFHRPPKFYKTRTFYLLSVVFFTFVIFGADFGYRYYKTNQLQIQLNNLNKQIKQKTLLHKLFHMRV